jgi:hypothetical protein
MEWIMVFVIACCLYTTWASTSRSRGRRKTIADRRAQANAGRTSSTPAWRSVVSTCAPG